MLWKLEPGAGTRAAGWSRGPGALTRRPAPAPGCGTKASARRAPPPCPDPALQQRPASRFVQRSPDLGGDPVQARLRAGGAALSGVCAGRLHHRGKRRQEPLAAASSPSVAGQTLCPRGRGRSSGSRCGLSCPQRPGHPGLTWRGLPSRRLPEHLLCAGPWARWWAQGQARLGLAPEVGAELGVRARRGAWARWGERDFLTRATSVLPPQTLPALPPSLPVV